MVKAEKWRYTAEYIEACNCDWGCPCNFGAPSTNGYCEGGAAVNIKNGTYGKNIKLDGVKFALYIKMPGLVHEGGGTGRIYVDERASREQRDAIREIVTGEAGGLPWGIFGALIDNWLETRFVPFEWKFEGAHSSYKVGLHAQLVAEPMRNPVTGQDSKAKITLPDGFVWKEGEMCTTRSFAVFDKDMKYAHPGKYTCFTIVHHSND